MSSKKAHRRKGKCCVLLISGAALFTLLLISVTVQKQDRKNKELLTQGLLSQEVLPHISVQTKLLRKNEYSRPGTKLRRVKGVVVHYTANPGTDAVDNRNYFNNLPVLNENTDQKVYASSHFVIGLTGQIVQCIPLDEIAYASNERNADTISIECCHKNKKGKFTVATYRSLLELVTYLCMQYDLETDDVIRHYDVTGKLCPRYYVEHEDQWEKFKNDIQKRLTKK